MKFKPLQDRILIRPMAEEERTAGGIIIPDTAKERPAEGEIVAVGPGLLDEDGTRAPLAVKKGERVLYAKYGGTEVKMAGEDFLIVRESDILAVVDTKTGAPKKKR